MTIRFFILQAHYRGTVDFSNEALQAAEKALGRMLDGYRRLAELKPSQESTVDVSDLERRCYEALDDDLNTPVLIGVLFDAVRIINMVKDGKATATADDIAVLRAVMDTFLAGILASTPKPTHKPTAQARRQNRSPMPSTFCLKYAPRPRKQRLGYIRPYPRPHGRHRLRRQRHQGRRRVETEISLSIAISPSTDTFVASVSVDGDYIYRVRLRVTPFCHYGQ